MSPGVGPFQALLPETLPTQVSSHTRHLAPTDPTGKNTAVSAHSSSHHLGRGVSLPWAAWRRAVRATRAGSHPVTTISSQLSSSLSPAHTRFPGTRKASEAGGDCWWLPRDVLRPPGLTHEPCSRIPEDGARSLGAQAPCLHGAWAQGPVSCRSGF